MSTRRKSMKLGRGARHKSAISLLLVSLLASLSFSVAPLSAEAANCSKINAIKVVSGQKFVCKKVGKKLAWVKQSTSTVVAPSPSQASEWSSCTSLGRTTSGSLGTMVCVLFNYRNVWVSVKTLDSKAPGSPCRTVGQSATKDGKSVLCEKRPGGNQWVESQVANPGEVEWASYGKECSVPQAVATGKGADGSNLVCKIETAGTQLGKQIWAYPEFPSISDMDLYVAAGVGGGYDTFGRELMRSMKAEGALLNNATFRNIPGSSGATGLGNFLSNETGKSGKSLVVGFPMVAGVVATKVPYLSSDAVSGARMTGEWEVVVVPANSQYRTLADLIADIKSKKAFLPVAGGNVGGLDHHTASLIYQAIGLNIKDLNYVPYFGGASITAALLSGNAKASITSYGEVAAQISAGTLRALAVSSPSRVPGIDAETLQSQGIDVVSSNWRGLMLPKGTSATNRNLVIRALDVTRQGTTWKSVLATQKWSDNWLSGDPFEFWLKRQEGSMQAFFGQLGF